MEIMYLFNDHYYEKNLWDVIDHLVEVEDLEKEDIVGYELDIAELEQSISNDTISQMQDILYNREEERFDENEYLENKLSKIWDSLKAIKMYYPSGKTYVITEEDFNDYKA